MKHCVRAGGVWVRRPLCIQQRTLTETADRSALCHVRTNAPQHFARRIGAVSLSAGTVLLTFWIQVRIAFASANVSAGIFRLVVRYIFNSAALEPLVSKFQDRISLLHLRTETEEAGNN